MGIFSADLGAVAAVPKFWCNESVDASDTMHGFFPVGSGAWRFIPGTCVCELWRGFLCHHERRCGSHWSGCGEGTAGREQTQAGAARQLPGLEASTEAIDVLTVMFWCCLWNKLIDWLMKFKTLALSASSLVIKWQHLSSSWLLISCSAWNWHTTRTAYDFLWHYLWGSVWILFSALLSVRNGIGAFCNLLLHMSD